MLKAPPDKPPDWVPPGQRPDNAVWEFKVYSFTVRLQRHQAASDHIGENVAVIAVNPDEALQALRDNFGDNLVSVRGCILVFGAAYMAASAVTTGAKGFLRRI